MFVKMEQQKMKVTVRKVKNVTRFLLKIQFPSRIGLRLNYVSRELLNGNGMLKHALQDKNNVEVISVYQLPILVLYLNSRKKQLLLPQPSRSERTITLSNMKVVLLLWTLQLFQDLRQTENVTIVLWTQNSNQNYLIV